MGAGSSTRKRRPGKTWTPFIQPKLTLNYLVGLLREGGRPVHGPAPTTNTNTSARYCFISLEGRRLFAERGEGWAALPDACPDQLDRPQRSQASYSLSSGV